ncbi:MAG: alkane 1-monooxygenase [Bacteroidota bacterium]
MKDAKYLFAYLIPVLTGISIYLQDIWSFTTVIFVFGLVPMIEPLAPRSEENLDEESRFEKLKSRFFDVLLYLNIPIVYGLVGFFIWTLLNHSLQTYEIIGMTLSLGIMIGANGINVAHELGHRREKYERRMAKILLLPALYMHFYIEHNRGHHKFVATALDPASAAYGENVYGFWIKSLIGSYRNAWQHEAKRMQKKGWKNLSLHNEMIWYQLIQVAYLSVVALVASIPIMLLVAVAGIIGALLLETINYVEHYGLRRKELDNGRFERVLPHHSWNANYEIGRILLYELTRHSDHHYIASKKYQILDHHEGVPELPFGYPTSMLIALLPPLWFRIMHKELKVQGFDYQADLMIKNS